jgi:hypothetical protein
VNLAANSLNVKAVQGGDSGRFMPDRVRFSGAPVIALEEAAAFYFDSGSVRRAAAASMADPANPVWSAGSEIGRHVTHLEFTYFDVNNHAVTPETLAGRISIARIDVSVAVRTSETLSTGKHSVYRLSARVIPRNLKIR